MKSKSNKPETSRSSRSSIRKSNTPKKRRPATVEYVVNNMRTTASKRLINEMKALQRNTKNMIPKLPFARLVREILMALHRGPDWRIQYHALQALQEATELYLTHLFSDACRCCAHAKRVTLKPLDMKLVLDIRGPLDPGF